MSPPTRAGPTCRCPAAFVEMLRRIVGLAGTAAATDEAAKARTEREVVPPTRVLDGFGAFGPPTATARPVPAGYVARATADHPPGFYGPPEGLLAVNTLAPADRLVAVRLRAAAGAARGLSARRAAGSARAGAAGGARAARARRAGGVLARRRHRSDLARGRSGRPRRSFSPARWRRCACGLAGLRARQRAAAAPAAKSAAAKRRAIRAQHPGRPRLRPEGHDRDAPRLCRHRRCRGRRHQQVPACRASRCSSPSAPRSRPASRSASTSRATSSRSSR